MTITRDALAGRLRHSVTIQEDISADGSNDPDYATWMPAVPCNIIPISGFEQYRGRQIEATVTHLVYMRWVKGVLPNMRLYDAVNDRYLNIIRVHELDGRRRSLEIQATELVV